MSEPQKTSKKKSKPKPGKSGRPIAKWIVSGVVFAVLGILVVLALQDFQAKQAASSTAEAWRNALRSKAENADLTRSEFSKVPVNGSPAITSEKAGPNNMAAVSVDSFTWKGTFRTYTVKVHFGLGADAPVEQIDGP
jgi:cytoskeletal protein RodZ